jgi:hypothetical protein
LSGAANVLQPAGQGTEENFHSHKGPLTFQLALCGKNLP